MHGVIPTGRWGHSSILLNDMLLVFYGGVDADKDLLNEIFAFDTGLLSLSSPFSLLLSCTKLILILILMNDLND